MIVSKFVKCITKLLNLKPYFFLNQFKSVPTPKFTAIEKNIISKEEHRINEAKILCENLDLENISNLRTCKIRLSKSEVCCALKGNLNEPPTCYSVPCCNLKMNISTDRRNKMFSELIAREKDSTKGQYVHTAPVKECKPAEDQQITAGSSKIIDQQQEDQNSVTKTNVSNNVSVCPYCTLSSSIPKNYACPFCAKSVINCTCIHCPHCKKSKIKSSGPNQNKRKYFKFDKPNCRPTGKMTPANIILQEKLKAINEKHNSGNLEKIDSKMFSKSKISKTKIEKPGVLKSKDKVLRPKVPSL